MHIDLIFTLFCSKNLVSGVRFQVSAQPPTKKTAGLIEKETLKKRMSIFCGSLFSPTAGCQSDQSNYQQTVPFW
jgi:hypothetical protein